MNFKRQQFETAATEFFQQNPRLFQKYLSPTLLQALVTEMLTSLPTVTAARIAFDRLVANGTLRRTDGRSERDDAREAVTAAQANFDATVATVDAPPLSREELEFFGSLSQRELAEKYWANDGFSEFKVRYDRAIREYGYVAPARPQQSSQASEGDLGLTAAQYHVIPARELQIKLRNPKFKLQVMQLIKLGLV